MSARKYLVVGVLAWFAGGQPVSALTTQVTPAVPLTQAAGRDSALPKLDESGLLLFELRLRGDGLTPSLRAYGNELDPLLPLGELSRLVELDVRVDPAGATASGNIGSARRSLTVDLNLATAVRGNEKSILRPGDFGVTDGDIYLRASIVARLLPMRFTIDPDNYIIRIDPTEELPVEARIARGERRALIGSGDLDGPSVLVAPVPYEWFSPPALDAAFSLATDPSRSRLIRRAELRAAGDLLRSTFTGFLGTDDLGRPSAATVRLERRSATGDLLGPIGASYAAIGDVFTPTLAMGARSRGGAGFALTTRSIGDASVFQKVTLRGELPLGYDIELYVNDILRGTQDRSSQGQYEFVDVPLIRGRNVIRILTYGPHGERKEQSRVIDVGGGQVAAGRLVVDAGAVLQERPTVRWGRTKYGSLDPARGGLRAVFNAAYGVSSSLTATAGAARFTDAFAVQRTNFNIGLRTSLLGLAIESDAASDLGRGKAAGLGVAGRLGRTQIVARHHVYSGDFADETHDLYLPDEPLRRATSIQIDSAPRLPVVGHLPLSGRLELGRYATGSDSLLARAGTSFELAGTFLALGTDYSRRRTSTASQKDWTANVSATRLIDSRTHVRGTADFDLAKLNRLRALNITGDRVINDRIVFRSGLSKSFGLYSDLTASAGISTRLRFADVTVDAGYSTGTRGLFASIQLNIGALLDPLTRRPKLARPGVTSGGSAAVLAFQDDNGNGTPDNGELGVANVKIRNGARDISTDAEGRALLTGLGTSPTSSLKIETAELENPYLTPAADQINFDARPGKVAQLFLPVTSASEAVVSLSIQRPGEEAIGIAAVAFDLVASDGTAVSGNTEYDGTAVFTALRPGRYQLRLDPAQASRLNMELVAPVELIVSSGGTPARVDALIRFAGRKGS